MASTGRRAGCPVLRVDARDLQAALGAGGLARQAATTARETANRNRERFQRLFEQQLIARARLEEVELAAEDARRRLEQAEAELAAIEVNLDYALLRAPFAGVVSEVLADVGTFVAPGPPLVIFEDRSRLEVNAAIGQDTGARLVSGATLSLRAEGVEQGMSGRVQALLPALERPGVGRRLRLVIDEPPPGLAPGMVVEIELPAAG
ncbi:MAG TPA: efflux RND transporter periplasmic adaptor subunit, partial [Kineobactrum sp.]